MEDIPQVCRNLSAITDTIMAIHDHKENPFPDDHVQNLANIFQITSVEHFNRAFATPINPKCLDASYQEGLLSINSLQPGDWISCDKYMSTILGRLPHTLGKKDKLRQLVGGTMFIDHATNFILHCHQPNLTSTASIWSKHALEFHLRTYGIKPYHYASDNHPFISKEWIADCTNQQQQWSLSSVGSHHQNYMEQHLQTIFDWAQTSLLCPSLAPGSTREPPVLCHWLCHSSLEYHTFQRPAYLPSGASLLNSLQQPSSSSTRSCLRMFSLYPWSLTPGLKKIPKWGTRSKHGIYLGVSPFHSSTVHLVLNPATGSITPQYHLVFDDTFSTVFSDGQFDDATWTNLLDHGHELHATIQSDSTETIHIPPNCVPFDSSSSPLSSTEGAPNTASSTSPSSSPTSFLSLLQNQYLWILQITFSHSFHFHSLPCLQQRGYPFFQKRLTPPCPQQKALHSQLQLHLHDVHSALQLVNHWSDWLFLLSMTPTTTFIDRLFQGLHSMSSIPTPISPFLEYQEKNCTAPALPTSSGLLLFLHVLGNLARFNPILLSINNVLVTRFLVHHLSITFILPSSKLWLIRLIHNFHWNHEWTWFCRFSEGNGTWNDHSHQHGYLFCYSKNL